MPETEEQYKPGSLGMFEFTPEDLKANQRGYLTDRQRGWLHGTARGIGLAQRMTVCGAAPWRPGSRPAAAPRWICPALSPIPMCRCLL